jgi:hypothetical protein
MTLQCVAPQGSAGLPFPYRLRIETTKIEEQAILDFESLLKESDWRDNRDTNLSLNG